MNKLSDASLSIRLHSEKLKLRKKLVAGRETHIQGAGD